MAAVDPSRRAELRDLLRQVHQDFRTTAVHVTHDLDEAAELGDRLAVMHDGRLVQHGPVVDVLHGPVSPLVARLTGNPNQLTGTVVRGRFRCEAGTLAIDAPDGPTRVTIRPEHLHRASDGLVARVADVRFRGSHTAVRLDVAGTFLQWTTTSSPGVDVGDTITVAAASSDVHAFSTTDSDVRVEEHT